MRGGGDLATVGELYELALSEWHLTPQQINTEWTEEQLVLMFKKRHQRLKRMAEEIEKLRDGDDARGTSESKAPKRVSNDAFFSKIEQMRSKGGLGITPQSSVM
jgi:hypothetical protein